jgi:hypothetical protein
MERADSVAHGCLHAVGGMKAKAAAEPAFDQLPSNVDQPSPASGGLHLTSLWRFFLIACRSFNLFFAVVGCADSPFVQEWENKY